MGTKDYDFYRRVDDGVSPAYFNNVAPGYSYRVRGKRCTTSSRTVCGLWSGWREIGVYPPPPPTPTDTPTPTPTRTPTATFTPTPTPTPVAPPPEGLVLSLDGDDLELEYERSVWPASRYHYYRFQLYRSDSRSGTYSAYGDPENDSRSPAYFDDVDPGWYRARGARCSDSRRADCGDWSGYSNRVNNPTPTPTFTPTPTYTPTATATPTHTPTPTLTPTPMPARLAAPENIDVEPRPLRVARISWDAVDGAKAYEVRLHNHLFEKDKSTSTMTLVPEIGIACVDDGETHYDVMLDRHLIDDKIDEFEVRAIKDDCSTTQTDRNANPINSEYSPKIRIKDNPIVSVNGDSRKAADGIGQALVKWLPESSTTGYTMHHRQIAGDHSKKDGWRPDSFANSIRVTKFDSSTSHTILGLQLKRIYAIRMNYIDADGVKVFSGRDRYVWPSKDFPKEDERVATYPFFGHWPTKEFKYRICDQTFPSNKRTAWREVIKKAFEQWEEETDGLVRVTLDSSKCGLGKDSPIDVYKHLKLNLNEVYMVDTTQQTLLQPVNLIIRISPSPFRQLSSYAVRAVTGQTDIVNFLRYADDIRAACVYLTKSACTISRLYSQGARAAGILSNNEHSVTGVDILFKKNRFNDDHIDMPKSVKFNQCQPMVLGENPDTKEWMFVDGHSAYTIALHEAGHALGTSGHSYPDILGSSDPVGGDDTYHRAHPSIPSATMNYNSEIHDVVDEPDCSPHPFDVLAIYALYQTVD